MNIPRTVAAKKRYQELVNALKASPSRQLLDQLEDLLGAERSSATRNRGIRERADDLHSTVAKDKRFQKRTAEKLAEPEILTPTKMEKHRRKLGLKP